VAPRIVRGAEVSAPVTPFVFDGDVRDLPPPRPWKPGDPIRDIPRRFYPRPGVMIPEYQVGVDPLLEKQLAASTYGTEAFTETTRSFPGQIFTGAVPADTVGDVGPNHYIQMVNSPDGSTVAIYDKAEPTPNLLASFTLDNLGGGVCAEGWGDPIVLYDRRAECWLLSEFSRMGNTLCVYISRNGDPVAGGWYAYSFTAPSFPDYPKYAVWPTDANGGQGSYIVTSNDDGPGIYALNRGEMLAGNAGTYQRVTIPPLSGFRFQAPTPADLDGPSPPPPGSPAIVMRHRDTEIHGGPEAPGDLLEMWTYDVNWLDPSATYLTTEPPIDVADFDSTV
jgi:hypothetical protein